MHWALKTISHGLRAEAEGREERRRRALKFVLGVTVFEEICAFQRGRALGNRGVRV